MTEVAHLPRRRRRGLLCIKVQLWRREVDALVACGLVQPAERQNRSALAAALHRYPDANPNSRTPMVRRNANTVTCHRSRNCSPCEANIGARNMRAGTAGDVGLDAQVKGKAARALPNMKANCDG
jgi:hypothetical protein